MSIKERGSGLCGNIMIASPSQISNARRKDLEERNVPFVSLSKQGISRNLDLFKRTNEYIEQYFQLCKSDKLEEAGVIWGRLREIHSQLP